MAEPSAGERHKLPGWQVALFAPLGGMSITLSLAPFNFWPTAILGCALLAYLLAGCNTSQALWRGWLFGLGMFGTYAVIAYLLLALGACLFFVRREVGADLPIALN